MNVKMTDNSALVLKTKGKYCPEDIAVEFDQNIKGDKLQLVVAHKDSLDYMFYTAHHTYDDRIDITDDELERIFREIHFNSATSARYMFQYCRYLTKIPTFDTKNIRDAHGMFYNCTSLKDVSNLDFSNVQNATSMFHNCSSLTTVPQFDTRNVTDMSYMFSSCSGLTTVPQFDTRNVTNMNYMFCWCTNLTTVPQFDTRNVTTAGALSGPMDFMFGACPNLTIVLIKNIKAALSLSDSPLLTMDSLLNLLNETVYSTTSKTLILGTANLAKFTGDYEYVKKTGVYLDLDDNEVTELTNDQTKIPVVWCSAEDEGAMTIADYMSEKGWILD